MNDVSDFFDQYDDIAVEVCDMPYPNEVIPDFTNIEICGEICDLMDWEYFDIFDDIDINSIYESKDPNILKAYGFMYLLRWQVFSYAIEVGIGEAEFNERAVAHSEMWYLRLANRYVEVLGGDADKSWLN